MNASGYSEGIIIMLDLDLPGREGLLEKPVHIRHTGISIVRPFDGRDISHVVSDLDGTLIHLRDPWHYWMHDTFMLVYKNSGLKQDFWTRRKVSAKAKGLIIKSDGIPAATQCTLWHDYILSLGGKPMDPQTIAATYYADRNRKTDERMQRYGAHNLEVLGARYLLQSLEMRLPGGVWIATGTDQEQAEKSAREFKFDRIIPITRVYGAKLFETGKSSKEILAERFSAEGTVPVIGDSQKDMLTAYRHKGIGVGFLVEPIMDYGLKPYLTKGQKREMLINGGASLIFDCTKNLPPCFNILTTVLFSRYP